MKRFRVPILVTIGLMVVLSAFGTLYYFSPVAEIKLTEPSSYIIGELIVIDAEKSPGVLQWTILPETQNFKIVGKKAYFSSSSSTRYTVFISGTIGGTLATRVFFLSPKVEPEVEPLVKREPKFSKIVKLIDGGIITSLDEAIAATKQLGLEIPEFKTLEEYSAWLK